MDGELQRREGKGGFLFVHALGSPFAREVLQALDDADLLQEVVTAFSYDPTGKLAQRIQSLPLGLGELIERELLRRDWVPNRKARVHEYPLTEVIRMLLIKSRLADVLGVRHQSLTDWVSKSVSYSAMSVLRDSSCNGVYAYEDGAAPVFHAAQKRGLKCILDLPYPHWKRSYEILHDEAEKFPELTNSLQSLQEPEGKLRAKKYELETADSIIVASDFTRESLTSTHINPGKIKVVPYGVSCDQFMVAARPPDKFTVLFVGRIGPRKGIHYLLQAWRALGFSDAELLLVGVNEFPKGYLQSISHTVRVVNSVPHHLLPSIYQSASCFVFPSLVEGFGLVLLEAMASGLPIISTPHTAAPSLIEENKEGFVIPVASSDALAERILWFYRNREKGIAMGRNARARAEQYTWARYRQGICAAVQ